MKTRVLPSVSVLLSSYNGEKYIEDQIRSIMAQKDVQVKLYIRDDCSKDNTVAVVKQLMREFDNIVLFEGKSNLNYSKSFLTLLNISGESDYYSFADQDDVWNCNKLAMAIRTIKHSEQELCLYASALDVVDEHLNPIQIKNYKKRKLTFGSFWNRFGLAGCTMVFPLSLKQKCLNYTKKIVENFPYNYGHDGWLVLLCLALGGKVLIDKNAYIKYRRHRDAVTLINKNVLTRLREELTSFRKNQSRKTEVVRFIHECLGEELNDEVRQICECILAYKYSAKYKLKMVKKHYLDTGIGCVDVLIPAEVMFNLL